MKKNSRKKSKPSLVRIEDHFGFPIASAAALLGVSKSFLKKVCMEKEIPKWPYRALRCINHELIALKRQLARKPENAESELQRIKIFQRVLILKRAKEYILRNPKSSMKEKFNYTNATVAKNSTNTIISWFCEQQKLNIMNLLNPIDNI